MDELRRRGGFDCRGVPFVDVSPPRRRDIQVECEGYECEGKILINVFNFLKLDAFQDRGSTEFNSLT